MMKLKSSLSLPWLSTTAAAMVLSAVLPSHAQTNTATAPPASSPKAAVADATTPAPDRSSAYFHVGLANIYESEAGETGNTEDARLAVEEYKSAINADPTSPQLNDGAAGLCCRAGGMREGEATAQGH